MTPLGLLNFVLLQWCWVRLARRAAGPGRSYTWLLGIVPLTGWWSGYVFVCARGRGTGSRRPGGT